MNDGMFVRYVTVKRKVGKMLIATHSDFGAANFVRVLVRPNDTTSKAFIVPKSLLWGICDTFAEKLKTLDAQKGSPVTEVDTFVAEGDDVAAFENLLYFFSLDDTLL
jgi:hypothetical protein